MGDSGEGLIDLEGRIQERVEELKRERSIKQGPTMRNPESHRALSSLKLARTELERQLKATTHDGRKVQLTQALEDIDRRLVETNALLER